MCRVLVKDVALETYLLRLYQPLSPLILSVTPQIIESNHKPTGATSAGVNLTQCSPVNRSGLDCLI